MNLFRSSLATVAACGLLFSAATSAFAKDYQITGTISAMTDTSLTIVTIQKETWDIGRDASTKLPDGAKVGDKVTVHYSMVAGNVEAKAAPAAAKDKKPAKGKTAAATSSKATTEPAASGSPSKPAAEAASPTP